MYSPRPSPRARLDDSLPLEVVEDDFWGDARPGATRLMETVHRLRRKPLAELTTEDLRVLIGQGVSLDLLVPLALDRLEHDPLLEGDLYPGDLLASVLRAPLEHWREHVADRDRALSVIREIGDSAPPLAAQAHSFTANWGAA